MRQVRSRTGVCVDGIRIATGRVDEPACTDLRFKPS